MRTYYNTNIGRIRSSNQDAVKVNQIDDNNLWSIVCDGMGGANGGNIASALATETIERILNDRFRTDLNEDERYDLSEFCINEANSAVFSRAVDDLSLRGMGTTAVLTLVNGENMSITHVGDSRSYLYSDGCITQMTEDHSYVQELINMGEITVEEARNHPRRNIITRSVGVHSTVESDYNRATLKSGDIYISCSDGLTNYMTEEILLQMIKNTPHENLCDELINFALDSGGADNITVNVILI